MTLFNPIAKDKFFYRYCWAVFIPLFTYLVIRAIYNEPLLDELTTYSNYIQSHKPHNPDVPIDANNHLLNTYLASCAHYLFGDNIFWLRLPNVLSFIFYFFSVVGILKYLNHNVVRYLSLLAFTCIPFITEYFAYCRGYGLSLMLLMVTCHQLLRFIHGQNPNAFIVGVMAAALAAMANLNVLSLSLFLFGYFFIISFGKKQLSIGKILTQRVLPVICYLGILVFLIAFSFQLKNGGALYWGGTKGLWETTGASLTKFVLFSSNEVVKYLCLFLLGGFLTRLVWLIVQRRWKVWNESFAVFALLLLGSLIFIEVTVRFMDLIYPLDRGGIHLVVLFLLALVFLIDSWKNLSQMAWLFLFFPLVFVLKMSVYSSVYSSEDRLTAAFYSSLRSQLREHDAILCDSQLAIPLLDKQLRGKKRVFIVSADLRLPTHSDIWITYISKVKPEVSRHYQIIASDPTSGAVAFRKMKPASQRLVESKKIGTERQHQNVYDLMKRRSLDLKPGETIGLEILGHFSSPNVTSNLELRIAGTGTNNENPYFTNIPLRMFFQNRTINEDFRINLKLDGLKTTAKEFLVYFWSPRGEQLVITNLRYNLYVINNNYGTR
ncbi:MAG: hypothetical protein QE487_05055 [Fluviicola sp.]|nr:hypothetical protein [Fluviicola sp.]